MRRVIFLALCVGLLSACSGSSGGGASKLAESECRSIQQKSNEIVKTGTGVDVLAIEGAKEADEKFIAACSAGQSYNRTDYSCIMAADSMESLNKCTAAAVKHI